VKSRQVPGTPFRRCSPRSSNVIPDPTTRSFTVEDTTVSPASASAMTRRAEVDRDASDVSVNEA
jgi:hypothetical protein